MKVLVNGELKELVLYEIENGYVLTNWVIDFIGDHIIDDFTYDEERDVYITDQETFEWWEKVIKDRQKLDERIDDLIQIHGYDKVVEAIDKAGNVELECEAAAINAALDEVFGKDV